MIINLNYFLLKALCYIYFIFYLCTNEKQAEQRQLSIQATRKIHFFFKTTKTV
jgi:hypothetical protein